MMYIERVWRDPRAIALGKIQQYRLLRIECVQYIIAHPELT